MPYKPEDRNAAALLRRSLGRKIRTAREHLGWSQDQLAESIGVGAEMLGRYERAAKFPSHLTLVRLAKVLRLSLDELLDVRPSAGVVHDGHGSEFERTMMRLTPPQREAVIVLVRELTRSPSFGRRGS